MGEAVPVGVFAVALGADVEEAGSVAGVAVGEEFDLSAIMKLYEVLDFQPDRGDNRYVFSSSPK